MTEPMNAEAVAQMVADMQAGTPGPWREAQTWRPPVGNGPHNDMVNGEIFWGYSICGSNEHGGHIYPTLASVHNFPDHIHANARRIARLPDLEAAYLALAAENSTLRDMMENAAQAMSETQPSWEYRCHAIMAALQIDFGGPTPGIPEEHTWYARNLRMANQRADKAEDEARSLRASEAAAVSRVKTITDMATDYLRIATEIGSCGDGGCVVLQQKGQHTNGGCHCLDCLDRSELRRLNGLLGIAQAMAKALTPTTDKEPKT